MNMRIYEGNCPVIYALQIVGGKWKLPVLWHLAKHPEGIRYNELKRNLEGITNIMLTRSLRELEEDGVISRRQYSDIPPHVEYTLTEPGAEIIPALIKIKEWGQRISNISNKNPV